MLEKIILACRWNDGVEMPRDRSKETIVTSDVVKVSCSTASTAAKERQAYLSSCFCCRPPDWTKSAPSLPLQLSPPTSTRPYAPSFSRLVLIVVRMALSSTTCLHTSNPWGNLLFALKIQQQNLHDCRLEIILGISYLHRNSS